MSGASFLAAKSALRVGAGLSYLATPKSLIGQLPPQEVIYYGLAETGAATIAPQAVSDVEAHLERCSALVLGPGISSNVETIEFVQKLVQKVKKPCVVDADGLNAVAHNVACWPKPAENFVLTPHPKELSRLIGSSAADIQSDRISAAQKAATKFGCTVVLKGAHTVVAGPGQDVQRVYINPTGNSGMATAGSGDVLSGIIGGLLAQGVAPFEAAVAGVYIHGAAGDMAAQELGAASTVAGDIMTFVPAMIQKLRNGEYRGSTLEVQLIGPRR